MDRNTLRLLALKHGISVPEEVLEALPGLSSALPATSPERRMRLVNPKAPPAPPAVADATGAPGPAGPSSQTGHNRTSVLQHLQRLLGQDLTEPRETRRVRLENLRDISEGLSGMGAAMAGSGLRVPVAEPAPADGLRRQIAGLEDERQLELRMKLAGAQADRKAQQAKDLAGARRSHEIAERKAREEFTARENALTREASANRLARPRPGRLPSGQLDKLVQSENAEALVQSAKELYDVAAAKGLIGPASSRVQRKIGQWTGMSDPDFRAFESQLEQTINEYVLRITGQAASDALIKRYMGVLGQAYDSPERFHAAMDVLTENIKRDHENRLKVLRGAGYDMSHFETATPTTPSQSGGVTMVLPDGREVPGIHPGQVQLFMKDHPGSRQKEK